MCTYLDQVGATYYFRRAVPAELQPFIATSKGAPRTEWKVSLRTKDREAAKRLIPLQVMATDAEIDVAREEFAEARARTRQNAPDRAAGRASERAELHAHAALEASLEAAESDAVSEEV